MQSGSHSRHNPCGIFFIAVIILLVMANDVIGQELRPGEAFSNRLRMNSSYSQGSNGSGTAAWVAALGLGAASLISKRIENANTSAEIVRRTEFMDVFIDAGNGYGDGRTIGGSIAAMLLAGQISGNNRLKSTGWDLAESYVLTTGIVLALKVAVDAKRPDGGKYSFPSGHTAAAFSLAPILDRHYGRKIGVAAYALASFTALGRIEDQRHFLSDVLFGAAVGITVGNRVSRGGGFKSILDHLNVTMSSVSFEQNF